MCVGVRVCVHAYYGHAYYGTCSLTIECVLLLQCYTLCVGVRVCTRNLRNRQGAIGKAMPYCALGKVDALCTIGKANAL